MRIIPQRIAPLIIGETDEETIKDIILDEIDIALTALSTSDLVSDVQAPEAAA